MSFRNAGGAKHAAPMSLQDAKFMVPKTWLRQGLPKGKRGFEQGPGSPGSFRELRGPFERIMDVSGFSRRDESVRGGRVGI